MQTKPGEEPEQGLTLNIMSLYSQKKTNKKQQMQSSGKKYVNLWLGLAQQKQKQKRQTFLLRQSLADTHHTHRHTHRNRKMRLLPIPSAMLE